MSSFRVTGDEVGEICEEDRAAWGPVVTVALGARPATKACTPTFCLVGAELAPVLVVVWRVEQARLPAVIFVAAGELCSMVVGAWGVSPTDVYSTLPSSRPRASVYCGSSQSHVAMELPPTSGLWPWLSVVVGGGWWLLPDASRRGEPKDLCVIFFFVKVLCAVIVVELFSVSCSTVSVLLHVRVMFP
ncbi:hypothetical protein BDA96_01G451300 [Sorghum bicolor]|uniref:Uncharacterized protein n=2 Tax=Sorghum bicolor TaxID=4558 RepID=A0A1B6QP68_SORBI|nr:hypothetical protein BDA96_01G451300 [Sorghum bicolor]KXG39707.1 hypothetical protein SORBI_3001G423900 [Sorghum bicolor]